MALFLIKKIIKKTGTYKRFVDCKKKASSEALPITVIAINKNKAPTKNLLNLNFETFSMIHIHKRVAKCNKKNNFIDIIIFFIDEMHEY